MYALDDSQDNRTQKLPSSGRAEILGFSTSGQLDPVKIATATVARLRAVIATRSNDPFFGVFFDSPADTRGLRLLRKAGIDAKVTPPRLDAKAGQYAPVPCWESPEQWLALCDAAFRRFYATRVHSQIDRGLSRDAFMAVARVRAHCADIQNGRHCRPTNALLVERTGLSRRVVQRATKALEVLGLATLVVRGRRCTIGERLAFWRAGYTTRGWASEYALTIPTHLFTLAQQLRGTPLRSGKAYRKNSSETCPPPTRASKKSTTKTSSSTPFGRAAAALKAWENAGTAPSWLRRDFTGCIRAVTAAVAKGWTDKDLAEALRIHTRFGAITPDNPGAYLRWVVRNFAEPPWQARMKAAHEHAEKIRQETAARRADTAARRASRIAPDKLRALIDETLAVTRSKRAKAAQTTVSRPGRHRESWQRIASRHVSADQLSATARPK